MFAGVDVNDLWNQTCSDGAEMTLTYAMPGACVTRADNPTLRETGPDSPNIDSWDSYQGGWSIIGGRSISTKVKNPLG